MAKTKSPKSQKAPASPKKRKTTAKMTAPKKGKPAPTVTLVRAAKYLATANANGGKEESTKKAYTGEWRRFLEFVHDMAGDAEKLEDTCQRHKASAMTDCRDGFDSDSEDEDGSEAEDDLDMDEALLSAQERIPSPNELLDAVEGDPTEHTPWVASLFFSYKAYGVDNCGPSTMDLINAAISDHYKYLRGDDFRGPWHQDSKGRWRGNPCSSAIVSDTYRACKNRQGEPERRHALPMKMQGMQQVYELFLRDCPTIEQCVDQETLARRAEWLEYMAYSTATWNTWGRVNESSRMQRKHLDMSPPPPPGTKDEDRWYKRFGGHSMVIGFRDRKGWRRRYAKGQHQVYGHKYYLFPTPQSPATDAYHHMAEWLRFYEMHLLKRTLEPEDHLFPVLSAGKAHPQRYISSACIMKLINKMTAAAGVYGGGHFTTHCFRRGGAQYRFMFAPPGERWPLSRIRWWGGWAKNEHRDTLMRYILDELHTYEEDHSGALQPEDDDLTDNEGPSVSVSKHSGGRTEDSLVESTVINEMRSLGHQLEDLRRAQQANCQPIVRLCNCNDRGHHTPSPARHPPGPVPAPAGYGVPIHHPTPFPYAHSSSSNRATPQWQPHVPPNALYPFTSTAGTTQVPATRLPTPPFVPRQDEYHISFPIIHAPVPIVHTPTPTPSAAARFLGSLTGHVVPEIGKRYGEDGWRQALKDWKYSDPERNHTVPLKEWPKEWREHRANAQQYHNRQVIANAYWGDRKDGGFDGNESDFCKTYPSHKKGITALVKEITARRIALGLTKARNRRR